MPTNNKICTDSRQSRLRASATAQPSAGAAGTDDDALAPPPLPLPAGLQTVEESLKGTPPAAIKLPVAVKGHGHTLPTLPPGPTDAEAALQFCFEGEEGGEVYAVPVKGSAFVQAGEAGRKPTCHACKHDSTSGRLVELCGYCKRELGAACVGAPQIAWVNSSESALACVPNKVLSRGVVGKWGAKPTLVPTEADPQPMQ
jgi:hypothetical protein